jgi:hypothetical protein
MTSTRSIRAPRKRWLVVPLLAVGIVLLVVQNSTVLYPDMDGYVQLDGRTIAVWVAHAPCSWTRVTDVEETQNEVRIKVETLPCPIPLPGTASLVTTELVVALAGDLGTRVVQDAAGQAVPALTGQTASPVSTSGNRPSEPKGPRSG